MATGSASIANMTVPNGGAGETLLMPKLQFRFRVRFNGFGAGDVGPLTRQVIDCSRPNVTFQEITMPIYNSTMYLSGKHQWQPMTLNLRDDASGKISAAVGSQLQKQLDFAEQASATAGIDYKFETVIEMLDGGNGGTEPTVLETWSLAGCFVQVANYNTLNYATNDVVTVALTIRFDNAEQYAGPSSSATLSGSVGAAIRTGSTTATGNGK